MSDNDETISSAQSSNSNDSNFINNEGEYKKLIEKN